MDPNATQSSASQGGATPTEQTKVNAALEDARAELQLVTEELSKKNTELSEISSTIATKNTDLNVLTTQIDNATAALSELEKQRLEKVAELNEIMAGIDANLASKTKVVEEKSEIKSGEVTIRFAMPAFRHNGVEYKSKDVEADAHKGEEYALQILDDLVKLKSGVIEIVNEGGE